MIQVQDPETLETLVVVAVVALLCPIVVRHDEAYHIRIQQRLLVVCVFALLVHLRRSDSHQIVEVIPERPVNSDTVDHVGNTTVKVLIRTYTEPVEAERYGRLREDQRDFLILFGQNDMLRSFILKVGCAGEFVEFSAPEAFALQVALSLDETLAPEPDCHAHQGVNLLLLHV
jgi:hypothetical protein